MTSDPGHDMSAPGKEADEIALTDSDLDTLAHIFEVLAQWDYEDKHPNPP